MHVQQTLSIHMPSYKAVSAYGLEFTTRTRHDYLTCAMIIYPLEEGGGLFPEVTVTWYTDLAQCERHARDWRNHGHRVEVVSVESVSSC